MKLLFWDTGHAIGLCMVVTKMVGWGGGGGGAKNRGAKMHVTV